MTLTTADLSVPLSGSGLGGALLDLLTDDVTANSQAIQRSRLLGDASGLGAGNQNLRNVPHCKVEIATRTGAAGWIVDADTDAVTVTRGELNITGPTCASTVLVTLQFRHTYDR